MKKNRWPDSEAGATAALEAFFAALNSGEDQDLFDTMHVPHVRISGNGVAIYNTREDLENDYLKGFSARAGDSWHHTVLESIEVLHSSESKVHLFIHWTRYDKGGGRLVSHQALWIMTKINGHWGAQARSSFAP